MHSSRAVGESSLQQDSFQEKEWDMIGTMSSYVRTGKVGPDRRRFILDCAPFLWQRSSRLNLSAVVCSTTHAFLRSHFDRVKESEAAIAPFLDGMILILIGYPCHNKQQ